jgi:putative transcriptional regulator
MANISHIRKELLKVTQAELATALGVTQGSVSFYESGKTFPPEAARTLIEYARTKGVDLTFDAIYADSQAA